MHIRYHICITHQNGETKKCENYTATANKDEIKKEHIRSVYVIKIWYEILYNIYNLYLLLSNTRTSSWY